MAKKRKGPLGETKLVREWMQKFHPNALQWYRVRVGPFPKLELAKMYGILRRWADVVFLEDDILYILEAKLAPDPGGLAQVELYTKLFPQTPEFSQFWTKEIRNIFLTTKNDKFVRELAKEKGIEFVLFSPQWVKDMWLERAKKGYR